MLKYAWCALSINKIEGAYFMRVMRYCCGKCPLQGVAEDFLDINGENKILDESKI
jgi:hypothetical protein